MGKTRTVENIVINAVQQATGKYTVPAEAAKDAAQVIINQTNNEPWFQSRVTLGSLGGVLGAITVLVNMWSTGQVDVPALAGALATLIGAAVALYGRWAAKKPLGA